MQSFDFDEDLKAIQSGKPITGSDAVLAPLIKQLTEAALSAEIDSYLKQHPGSNHRNGYSKKTVKSAVVSFELETPRDRNGEFHCPGVNHWLYMLTDLHNRGVQDILIACFYSPKGFPEAIQAIFPNTEVQLCVIHQIRNSIRYVASKDQKAFMRDLKPVYKAVNEESAELALDELDRLWGSKYPTVIASWRDKWHLLSAYFKYPDAVRKPIYTTNAALAVHRQFRKLTKTKGAFPNQTSLLKLLYVGMLNASEKWTMPINKCPSIIEVKRCCSYLSISLVD